MGDGRGVGVAGGWVVFYCLEECSTVARCTNQGTLLSLRTTNNNTQCCNQNTVRLTVHPGLTCAVCAMLDEEPKWVRLDVNFINFQISSEKF